jgi:serine/threonine protein kinase
MAEKAEEMKQHVPGTYARILSQEVRLLQVLDHPNIIKLYRMIETEQDYYIIMYASSHRTVV